VGNSRDTVTNYKALALPFVVEGSVPLWWIVLWLKCVAVWQHSVHRTFHSSDYHLFFLFGTHRLRFFGPAADYPDVIIASMPTLGFHCVSFEVGKALFIAPVRKPDSYSNLTNT